ncbi:phosphoenolpyruvate-utilizing N-terminal domain-containing protein, partial [Alcaligenes pakistanensis]
MGKGYAIAKAVVMSAAALEVPHYRIAAEDVDSESQRLLSAMASARDELRAMVDQLPVDAPRELAPILTVHSLLLDDPMLTQQTCAIIAERHYNAEWALTSQGQMLVEQFSQMEDEYLRERGADVRQVIERVLRVLAG